MIPAGKCAWVGFLIREERPGQGRAGKGRPAQGFCFAQGEVAPGQSCEGLTQIHGSSVNFKVHRFALGMRLPKIPGSRSQDPRQLQSSSGFPSGAFFPPPSLLLGGSAPFLGMFATRMLKSSTGCPFPWNVCDGCMDLLFRGWTGVFPSRKNQGIHV